VQTECKKPSSLELFAEVQPILCKARSLSYAKIVQDNRNTKQKHKNFCFYCHQQLAQQLATQH